MPYLGDLRQSSQSRAGESRGALRSRRSLSPSVLAFADNLPLVGVLGMSHSESTNTGAVGGSAWEN